MTKRVQTTFRTDQDKLREFQSELAREGMQMSNVLEGWIDLWTWRRKQERGERTFEADAPRVAVKLPDEELGETAVPHPVSLYFIRAAPFPAALFNTDEEIVDASDALVRLFPRSRDEILGSTPRDLWPGSDVGDRFARLNEEARDAATPLMNVDRIPAGRAPADFMSLRYAVRGDDGEPHVAWIAFDLYLMCEAYQRLVQARLSGDRTECAYRPEDPAFLAELSRGR